jgi:predicted Rossmann fold flavoprotein
MNSQIFDVIVIGGGAAGMMAAGQAASRGKNVLLLEKNRELGEKLKITGGGRCNITNAEYDNRILLSHYGKAADFLYSPFSQFSVENTFTFFESLGLPLVIQARNRAFPNTEKAEDVFRVLNKFCIKNNVRVRTACKVKKINFKNGQITSVETNIGEFFGKSFILATGGVSHPETGSNGDGFNWLRDLGHSVQEPTPTIVPLSVEENWVKSLAGVSLSFMKITFFLEGQRKFSETGKILFTHFGLSGPLILNSASKVHDLLQEGLVTAQIDAFPDTDLGSLDKKIINLFDQNKNKEFKSVFKELVPRNMSAALSTLVDISPEAKIHSISRDQRKSIVNLLKAMPITINGLMGNDRAVSADGGVMLSEIDTKTMKSKLFDNLYIIGDLLHINRPSGGYSLQLCWTTGYVAGDAAASKTY